MTISLKTLLAATLGLLAGSAVQAQGADNYPSKPIRVVVPFAAGSATDIMARSATDELRGVLGQTFLIENRVGANGFIAAENVARSAPDGYTLFVTASTTHSTNPHLFKKLPYDPVKDFTPVGGMMEAFYTMVVHKDLPVNTLQELAGWLKANSAKASYGWGGTISQLGGFAFLQRIGVNATGVPYKSSPQAMTDLIGGQLSFIMQDVTTALAHVRGGRVKALSVTASRRIPALATVPTMAEAGFPDFPLATWVGMYAPANTPPAIVNKVNAALNTVLRGTVVGPRMDACCSAMMFPTTPVEFGEYVRKDRELWGQRIAAAGIQPE